MTLHRHNKRKDGRYIVNCDFCHFLDKDRKVENLEKKNLFYWTHYTTSLRKITLDIYI